MSWWLNGQFSSLRRLVFEKTEQIKDALITKLEYHEKHDDARFQGISNDLWDIRVRNAARDGHPITDTKRK